MLALFITLPANVFSQQATDVFSGHFAREGNNGSPAKSINSNIYIKLFKDQDLGQWVAMLFVPYPYAATVEPAVIEKVFIQAKKETTSSAYIRSTFGQLAEKATVQIEKFGYMEDNIIFECGSMAPCTIKIADGYLELIKLGIINEHIVKYDHVVNP